MLDHAKGGHGVEFLMLDENSFFKNSTFRLYWGN